MAQGQIKKPSLPSSKPTTNKSGGITKRGSRQINPKNPALIKRAKINKKFTSGLTAQTERMLGERAGHLEMLGQGKNKKKSDGSGKLQQQQHGKKNAAKKG